MYYSLQPNDLANHIAVKLECNFPSSQATTGSHLFLDNVKLFRQMTKLKAAVAQEIER